jgi:hypothetical protein
MGLFGSLFGGKKEANVASILKTVEQSGGQGVVQVPIEIFAKYLHENGEQSPSQDGAIEGFVYIEGEKRKVGFQYGGFQGLKEGETLVTVFQQSNIEDEIESIGTENMAKGISDALLKNITSKDMAMVLTYGLLCETTLGGGHDIPEDIDRFSLKCSDGLTQFDEGYMEALEKNVHGKFNNVIQEPRNVFKSVRSEIYDESKKQELSYQIMRTIIKKWSLI